MKTVCMTLILLVITISVVNAQELTVVTEEFPPFNYLENGKITGISTEVVNAALAKAGLPAKIQLYPWARAYKMASEQANVLIYTLARTPDRENLFQWIGPIAPPIRAALFKLAKRTELTITSLDDAKRYKIGVVRDDGGHQILLHAGFENDKNLFPVTQGEQNIEKLLAGRIDLMFSENMFVTMKMKTLNLPVNQVAEAFLAMEVQNYMAFSKQTPDAVVAQVRKAFEQIQAEGAVAAIAAKYLKADQ